MAFHDGYIQINVTYIGNESRVGSVAPFIAVTGANWPKKFGGFARIA